MQRKGVPVSFKWGEIGVNSNEFFYVSVMCIMSMPKSTHPQRDRYKYGMKHLHCSKQGYSFRTNVVEH